MQFAGFERLFARFLQEQGPSIDWEKISPPPEAYVSYAEHSQFIFSAMRKTIQ